MRILPEFPEVTYTSFHSKSDMTKAYTLDGEVLVKTNAPVASSGRAITRIDSLGTMLDSPSTDICHIYGVANPEPWSETKITEVSRPRPGHITRTKENFHYPAGSGVLLLDNDPRPDAVPPIPAVETEALAKILEQCVPGIGPEVAYVGGPSSGAGSITDVTTNLVLKVSEGTHRYFAVDKGQEIARIGEIISKRLWLNGYGSIAFARNGAMLVRTLIDTSVWQSNRIDYVCPSVIGAGLVVTGRAPITKRPGRCIVANEIAPLNEAEEATYRRMVAEAKTNAKARSEAIAEVYMGVKEMELVDAGVDPKVARETVLRACDGKSRDLYGDWLLKFAHLPKPIGVSEAVKMGIELNGKALADPIEGTAYGATTAMFFFNAGEKPFINSNAHGGTTYFLHANQPEILFAELLSDSDDFEVENEDKDNEVSDEVDGQKALASAKKAAINGEPPANAVKRLLKHWPSIQRIKAQEIVQKAYQWRERFAVGKTTEERGVTKKITDLASLNARFALLQADGQSTCVVHVSDSLLITWNDFSNRVLGEVVLVGVNAKGAPLFRSAYDFWRESCEKRKFTKVVFTSKKTPHMNLFNGFGVEPDASKSCQLILQHINEVICANDRCAAEAMLNLIAWQIQNIGKPSRTIVSLYSEEQQVGKGVLLENLLLPIYGLSGFMTSDKESCLGRFNDALRGKSFLFLDEAAYAKDRRLADRLKGLAVASSIPIESKGVPVITMPSGVNIWMATNHKEVASIETHDCRYWVLEVSSHRVGDHEYFAALAQEIDNGGKEAFLAMMLDRDVSAFVPQRDIPRNNALMA